MRESTAQDAQRLLATQPLLDQLLRLDLDASAANLRAGLCASLEELLEASVAIAAAGHNSLLQTIRHDIDLRSRARNSADSVREAALQAAVAVAFPDVLGEERCATLSLPWALAAVEYSELELEQRLAQRFIDLGILDEYDGELDDDCDDEGREDDCNEDGDE